MNLDEFLRIEPNPGNDADLVDLRALEYTSDYDEHLMCPICHCPFVNPVRLHCDHVFCQECLSTAIICTSTVGTGTSNFKCPGCRVPSKEVFLNVPRLLVNMCNEIQVKCPFSDEGCGEIIPRGHVQAHVDKYCNYRLLDCPDESCEKKTRRKDFRSDNRCVHTLRSCPNCDEQVMDLDFEVCHPHVITLPLLMY